MIGISTFLEVVWVFLKICSAVPKVVCLLGMVVFEYVLWLTDASYNREVPTWMALIRAVILCNKSEFRANQQSVPILKRLVLLLCYDAFATI